ncbi:MAG: HPr family phosphocarrier protein [Oscillospiraceae bacterium]|nr:HPr family phosphocarrier protein [Oscillospiraceae bacterium]
MRECYVSFTSALEVHDFVSIATKQYFPIQVERDNLRTDAKSIMSLCSMGFNRPLHVLIPESADSDAFFAAVEPYTVV